MQRGGNPMNNAHHFHHYSHDQQFQFQSVLDNSNRLSFVDNNARKASHSTAG